MLRASILAAVAAFSSTALAQGNLISQIPQCAQVCFGNNLGSCGPLDIGCICGNAPVINTVACCVFATCSETEISNTITFATNLCSLQNVQLDTTPDCPASNVTSTAPPSGILVPTVTANATASALPTSNATASAIPTVNATAPGPNATNPRPTATAAAAPLKQACAGLGLGAVMAFLFAYL